MSGFATQPLNTRRRTSPPAQPALRLNAHLLNFPTEEIERAESEDSSSWTVSYLDVLLLLLTLFAVLLGTTWLKVAQTPAQGVPAPVAVLEPAPKASPPASLEREILLATLQTMTLSALIAKPPAPEAPAVTPPTYPTSDLEQLAQRLAEGTQGHLDVVLEAQRIRLEVRDDILFPPGSADLGAAGNALLEAMAQRLKSTTLNIMVEGHTDNTPIANERFPSNWELSSFRATRVARYLISQGVDEAHVQVTGYADTRPRVPNDNPAHQAQNRRVSIVLQWTPALDNSPAAPTPVNGVQII